MAIIFIKNPADLKKGDKVVFAPFGMRTFQNEPRKLQKKKGDLGFYTYDDDGKKDAFFVAVTKDGKLRDDLVLVEASRNVVMFEDDKHLGKEVITAADLPADYGVLVIVRHPEHGDYRGWASNDKIDGWEWIHMMNGAGRGSFHFWRSMDYKIYLAVGIEEEYNL